LLENKEKIKYLTSRLVWKPNETQITD